MSTDYLGSELYQDPADSPFAPRKLRVTFECQRCGHTYKKVFKAVPSDPPPCPKKACRATAMEAEIEERAFNLAKMLEEQRAPGHIGANTMVRAVDQTAEIVMADHKMTDLKDNLRVGDVMAPKLPAPMQHAADNFFTGKGVSGNETFAQKRMQMLGQRAIAGHFRSGTPPPSLIFGDRQPGEKALRSLGKDPLSKGA